LFNNNLSVASLWTVPSSVCRYEPSPASVVQKIPTCVVEEPEDWMREYPDTPSQPFQLREFRTGQLVGVMASSIRDGFLSSPI
jgi:hypothetical protein